MTIEHLGSVSSHVQPAAEPFLSRVLETWVQHPLLTVVQVPDDLDTYQEVRRLRDVLCERGDPDPEQTRLVPAHALPSEPADWPVAIEDQAIPFGQYVHAARCGGTPFFLLIFDAKSPQGVRPGDWLLPLASRLGSQARASGNPSRLTLIVTCNGPLSPVASYPEHTAWVICEEPLGSALQRRIASEVEVRWTRLEPEARQYLILTLFDMASGRAYDAEAAIESLTDSTPRSDEEIDKWRPWWVNGSAVVQRLAITLEDLKRTQGLKPIELWERADELWKLGAWVRSEDVPGSLTSRAWCALNERWDPAGWPPGPTIPRTTTDLLRRTLEAERSVKHWVLTLLDTSGERDSLVNMLAKPVRGWPSFADYLLKDVPDRERPLNPQPDVVIRESSFGPLLDFVGNLGVEPSLLSDLRRFVVPGRNRAAHGHWFTLGEFGQICRASAVISGAFLRRPPITAPRLTGRR